jgi:hypothetical protein
MTQQSSDKSATWCRVLERLVFPLNKSPDFRREIVARQPRASRERIFRDYSATIPRLFHKKLKYKKYSYEDIIIIIFILN